MTRDPYASLKQGLVGCWIPSVSGSGLLLPDLSGRGNNGSLVGMDASDWVSASYGRALDFDGVNDYVSSSNNAGQFLGNQPFSISVFFQVSIFGRTLVARRADLSTTPGEYGLFAGGSGTPFAYICDGNSYQTRLGVGGTTGILKLNTLHHLVMTWNGGTTFSSVRFYVDGKLDSSNDLDSFGAFSSIKNASIPLTIGGMTDGSYTSGMIFDVRAYNRILTEPEIRLLASRPGIGLQPSPTRFIAREKKTGLRRILMTGQT